MSEHTFVVAKDDVNEIVQWIYRHDIDRKVTSYVYGSFSHPKHKEAFRGIRLHIADIELAMLFKITYYEKIMEGATRSNDMVGLYGFKF
jgi:hypothetical protein